jgi:hypothetical protein
LWKTHRIRTTEQWQPGFFSQQFDQLRLAQGLITMKSERSEMFEVSNHSCAIAFFQSSPNCEYKSAKGAPRARQLSHKIYDDDNSEKYKNCQFVLGYQGSEEIWDLFSARFIMTFTVSLMRRFEDHHTNVCVIAVSG